MYPMTALPELTPYMATEGTKLAIETVSTNDINGEGGLAAQVWSAAAQLAPAFTQIDHLVAANLRRVQAAMARARLGPHHFAGSSGYGHGDLGRAALDEVAGPPLPHALAHANRHGR